MCTEDAGQLVESHTIVRDVHCCKCRLVEQ